MVTVLSIPAGTKDGNLRSPVITAVIYSNYRIVPVYLALLWITGY
jgi:hypothetical protein